MKILVKGAGDLATGVAYELFLRGHQIIMTEIPIPLTVRRQVAFSRAVYEQEATVEGVTGVCTETPEEACRVSREGKIAVIVDPEGRVADTFCPDVIVDGIMAKKNVGTAKTDAPIVIALGPGFEAGQDCHAVVETMRGDTLGKPLYKGRAIPNTGVPGMIGGYALERLIKAAGDGPMQPVKQIGDIVKKGDILAYTGEAPVTAQIDGIIRGMLQPGVIVQKGLKIGDVDPRQDPRLVHLISDKARKIGVGVCEAIRHLCRENTGLLLLAAGESLRYGGDKLLDSVENRPMYTYALEKLLDFPESPRVVVTHYREIEEAAQGAGIETVRNDRPKEGIALSLHLGLKRLLEIQPDLQGVLCLVCDQPRLSTETLEKLLLVGANTPSRIVCAGEGERRGNPVWFGQQYFKELLSLKGDVGGKQVMRRHPEQVHVVETPKEELEDIDYKK